MGACFTMPERSAVFTGTVNIARTGSNTKRGWKSAYQVNWNAVKQKPRSHTE